MRLTETIRYGSFTSRRGINIDGPNVSETDLDNLLQHSPFYRRMSPRERMWTLYGLNKNGRAKSGWATYRIHEIDMSEQADIERERTSIRGE